MDEVIVVAEIPIAKGKRDEALAGLERLCAETHAKDEGCVFYALQLDPADESRVFMVEKWASAELLKKHDGTDHLAAFACSGVLGGAPTINVLRQAGFGDPEKGTL